MHIIDDKDNIFSEGSIVHPKAAPEISLLITKYQQRIYFCKDVSAPAGKPMPYFERELAGA